MNFWISSFIVGGSVPLYILWREWNVSKKACQEPWLSAIESGEKEYEARLLINSFWANVRLGDPINLENQYTGKLVRTRVKGIRKFKDFDEAGNELGDKLIPHSVHDEFESANMTPGKIYRDFVWRYTCKFDDSKGNFDEDKYNKALEAGVVAVQLEVRKGFFWWLH